MGQHTSTQSNLIGQDTSTQSNTIGEGASTQNILIGEGDSSGSHARTLVILLHCVSNNIRDEYFGEFKKHFYLDSSINEGVVRRQ
ncbi:hypothetical protein KY289_026509 [Solanum tuberosum]|nr:hypothetical protein KY289_026509 [Solanum tuberosum]